MTFVVDASVALKWFLPEPDSETARSLLVATTELLAPTLIVAEVCNAAWKRLRRGETTVQHADWIANRIASVGLVLIPDQTLAAAAMALARSLDHPVYDCLYLALAGQRDATMVTADRRLVARVAGTVWEARVRPLSDVGTASSGPSAG